MSEPDQAGHKKRKRGIKASRAKLLQALTEAGFKTQTALADKIADIEGLDSSPKDMVNRAFRERSVEPVSIERIAKALGVSAHTLYLSAEEVQKDEISPKNSQADNENQADERDNPRMPSTLQAFGEKKYLSYLASIFVFILIAFHHINDSQEKDLNEDNDFPISIVITPSRESLQTFAYSLQDKLRARFNVTVIPQALLTSPIISADVARQYQADIVLTLMGKSVGRHLGVEFFLYSNGEERQIWSNAFTKVEYHQYADEIARQSIAPVLYWLDNHELVGNFAPPEALEFYLRGRNALDHNTGELHIKRAQTDFNNALIKYPDYALAYAGQCEALVYESWVGKEKRLLENANDQCIKALALNNQHPYTMYTKGNLLRRFGKVEKAREHYESLLKKWPDNVDALIGLGNVEFTLYRQGKDPGGNILLSAEEHLLKAGFADPDYWRSFFYLASIQFSAGKISKAIRAAEYAVSGFPNELAMVNLGTMYFCKGENTKSRDIFLTARKLAPDSYLGHEFMAMVYYFLEDYQAAAKLQENAIEAVSDSNDAGIHQMWGSLAESQRHLGLNTEAIKHYKKAIEIIERDFLRGNASVTDKVYRAYYYRILHEMAPEVYSFNILPYSQDELQSYTDEILESGGYIKLAQIFLLDNRQDSARSSLSKAVAKCPVYATQPDLKGLGGVALMP